MAESTPGKEFNSLSSDDNNCGRFNENVFSRKHPCDFWELISRSESILILLERLYTGFTIADDSTAGLSTVEALR